MKISELIHQLENLKHDHGDIEVGVNPAESGFVNPVSSCEIETDLQGELGKYCVVAVVIS